MALQWMLTHSFTAKLLAVKRVTENSGKRTPGVDDFRWKTPTQKLRAALSLSRKDYKAMPLRRLYILKKNGKQRPLGIPTMQDRAYQALHLLALQPVAETTADKGSYGFRPYRSCHDAIERCYIHLSRNDSATWVLEGDIKGCFDNISHQWLIENIPMDRKILQQISQEKTKITHISEGFNFLGQNIRMYSKRNLLIRPSDDSIKAVKTKLKEIIVKHRGSQAAVLIRNLNPVITGWANYHRNACSKKTFYKLDRILWRNIWNWARSIAGAANPFDPAWEKYFLYRKMFKKNSLNLSILPGGLVRL